VIGCNAVLDLRPFDLATDYCVAYRLGLSAAPNAFEIRGDRMWTVSGGGSPYRGTVTEWDIDPVLGKLGGSTLFFSFAPATSAKVFVSDYLALSESGATIAAGYTEDQTIAGAIYWGTKGNQPPKQIDQATGNYDAVFVDDQTLLVNGIGLGSAQLGQGVYVFREGAPARRLIKDIGNLSGHLARGQGTFFAGGYFSKGNMIYGFSLAEVRAALASGKEISATAEGDLVYAGGALDVAALGDDLVVARTDASSRFEAVTVVRVTMSGDTVTPSTVEDLVTGGSGATLERLATSEQGLGLLLGGAKPEIALVQKRGK
jgi:hypothetical protein